MVDRKETIEELNDVLEKTFDSIKGFQKVFNGFSNIANNLSSYPVTEAEVIESVLVDNKIQDQGDAKLNPVVVFSYEVNGRSYVSNNKKISVKTSNNHDAIEFLQTYSVGDKIQVHYNPKNPQEAYLKADLHRLIQVSKIFGGSENIEKYDPIHCTGCGARISIKDSVCKYCENPVY